MRRPLAFSLALASMLVLGQTAVEAAPRAHVTAPKPKGVGPKVFTKLDVPAIRISDVAKADEMVPTKAPPDPNPNAWKSPTVAPFEGVLAVTAVAPVAGPVGATMTGGSLFTIERPGDGPGFFFIGEGQIGISMPRSAAGGSDLLVSCEGYLPSTLTVVASFTTPVATWSGPVMELKNLKSKAKFVVVPDGLSGEKNSIITVGIAAKKAAGWWRVDRCTIERV